jgi:hypothetical protein
MLAGKAGVRSLIVPGGASKAPVKELEQISHEYGIYIEVMIFAVTQFKSCYQ